MPLLELNVLGAEKLDEPLEPDEELLVVVLDELERVLEPDPLEKLRLLPLELELRLPPELELELRLLPELELRDDDDE